LKRRQPDWPRRLRWPGAVALVLLAFTLITSKGGNDALYPAKPGDQVAIYVLENGFHTDLVLPRDAVLSHGGPLAVAMQQAAPDPWMRVGWGDARFYEDQSPWQGRILDGLTALFGGRPTVVHLQGVWASPDRVFRAGFHRLMLSREGLAALMARADRSFALDAAGLPYPAGASHGAGEQFFASGEVFSGIHLCNHWAGETLNAAGVPDTPVLDTLPAGLVLNLKLRAGM
jgi:uncharacterized protein (TIGR02117 family)